MRLFNVLAFVLAFGLASPANSALRPEGPPEQLAPIAKAEWWIGAVSVMVERCGHMSMVRDLRVIAKSSEVGTVGHRHWLSILSPQACSDVERVGAFILTNEADVRRELDLLNTCENDVCNRADNINAETPTLLALLSLIETDTSRWFGYDRCDSDCL